ncbi:TetR/AcrR family transcriptional regulator [Streptomyces sp. NPDC096191]|uniref:TetR/AcrR family transcriptional regulator n=1 Tax=Streptomyces sp. NPDC096191 TaxID=3155426 RepID=UPI00333292A8
MTRHATGNDSRKTVSGRRRPRRDIVVKQDRARRTHESLLDAAAKEFVRYGYTGANLQRVADLAGMTKGALYAHFPSKEALAGALTVPFEQTWHELLRQAEATGPVNSGALSDLLQVLVRRLRVDLRFRAGFHLTAEYARARRQLSPAVQDLDRLLPSLIHQAQERGDVSRAREPEILSRLLLTLICGVHFITAECQADFCPEEVSALWQLVPRPPADTAAAPDEADCDARRTQDTERAERARPSAHGTGMARAPGRAARSCGSSPTTVGCPTAFSIGRSET